METIVTKMAKSKKQVDPIGKKIEATLKQRDMTVAQLARKIKIPDDRIYKWIKGHAPKYADRIIINSWIDGKPEPESDIDRVRMELRLQKAKTKEIMNILVKLMAKVYNRPLEDCIEEVENNIKLIEKAKL